ncbi:hypothetical protein [Cerasicoccus arenae]|uniref:hypothetical protein n=1 Tax=Cerasicoccus arenae TaxID=424488 RepID=UPI001679B85F|nr:hypothetical protein [Cerasicoccus arenae]MBK1859943.1 hypothetical protein [Cerasicoccus arenae]
MTYAEELNLGEKPSVILPLKQFWLPEPEKDFLPAVALLYPRKDSLEIVVTMKDAAVYSDANGSNQFMWKLGDVVEIFIGVEGKGNYWELHVTPNNYHLQLHWSHDGLDNVRAGEKSIEDFMVDAPSLFESQVSIGPEKDIWQVHVTLPWQSIGLAPGQCDYEVDMAICRYDATPGVVGTVLSSTAPLRARSYHRRLEWNALSLTPQSLAKD